ncbi:Cobalt-zinc-cadmium resistance protein CzcA; Cation efflux system protein CusA [hydrothermal vent metagenome]|uniref:Cobalt-zinc-cadmium resistance protein CzcA Cation efflux system protein CusA n=1 Tax=hydrothermal vent metagenome TaxID=652676 RepID=A0A3B0WT64_9ZZZZ
MNNPKELIAAIMVGAVQRVRPKVMTVSVIVVGLLPIMFGTTTGSEVMKRIAAPMIGGMISAPVVSMLLIPVLTYLLYKRRLFKSQKNTGEVK